MAHLLSPLHDVNSVHHAQPVTHQEALLPHRCDQVDTEPVERSFESHGGNTVTGAGGYARSPRVLGWFVTCS